MGKIDIEVHRFNELYDKLVCDRSIERALLTKFSYFAEGYKYHPSYKYGYWDGKIRLYNQKTKLFYKELFYELIRFAKNNSLCIATYNRDKGKIEFDSNWLTEDKVIYVPKDYQKKAFEEGLKENKRLILSPTGSGKSLIIFLIFRYIIENTNLKILITVPSTNLVIQLKDEFENYSGGHMDLDTLICASKDESNKKRCLISTWQGVYKNSKSFFKPFGAYMCDEAHEATAKSLSGIITKMSHAQIRIGLTGSIKDAKLHELELMGRFGRAFVAATTHELQQGEDLSNIRIKVLKLVYAKRRKMTYQEEISFLVSSPERNKIIVESALSQNENTLILFNFIEKHGKVLQKMLKGRGKRVFYFDGNTLGEERDRIKNLVENERGCILLAPFKCAATGMNIKNLHNVIFAHPFKAKIRLIQSIGRVLRLHKTKEYATLIDIADDMGNNITLKHFNERQALYQNQKFPYEIKNIVIEG